MAAVWWLVVGVVVLMVALTPAQTCPNVCICKWKNGKQWVDCKDQGLASIPSQIHPDTQVLDLTGNNLQTLPRHAFARVNLVNLQKIYLSDCKIGRIDPTAFSQLTNLVQLDLSDNLLTEVPAMAFSHAPALRELQLRGNRLRKIQRDSFSHTPSIVSLDLSYAGIRSVAPQAFQSMSLLEKIKLQGNQLSELPKEVVRSLARVHGIEIHDNPWMCDCRALPLWSLLEEQRVSHTVSPACHAPHRVAKHTFHSLTVEDFSCPPQILPVGRRVEGVAGENATIACPVGGQPPPQVVWYKGEAPVVNGSVVGVGPQRLYVITEGNKDLISRLIITGAQETDSGTLRCVAINSAGSATANFTLAVTMRAAEPAKLDSSHIAGISVGLVVLALIVLIVGFLFVVRARSHHSPTPTKNSPSVPPSGGTSPCEPNPVQKPPRLTEVGGSPGSVTLGNPDVISEAARAVNGHLPNGSVVGEGGGDYTRVEGDSLYPSGLWPEHTPRDPVNPSDPSSAVIHEHFNPGYLAQDPGYGPLHSTPYRPDYEDKEEFDPQMYGYPADYGLPIPEAGRGRTSTAGTDLDIQESRDRIAATPDIYASRQGLYSSKHNSYASRQDVYASQQDVYASQQDMYASPRRESKLSSVQEPPGMTSRPPVYGYNQDVYGSREDVLEGAESPPGTTTGPPGERPWVPGSGAPPQVRGGVAVLPPLPTSMASRIKARDSPDEGYQEGTEV